MSDRKRAFLACVGLTVGLIAAVLLPAFATRWAILRFALWSTWKEKAILVAAMLVAVPFGFLQFASANWAWTHWWRGWRVCWIAKQTCAYEEFDDAGHRRSFEFGYEALKDEYAPPCRITIPSATDWNRMLPSWAHDRRDAIVERIRLWGAYEGWNAPVTFVDTPGLDE